MKFNWGFKLMLFFGAFVALMIYMVVKSTQQKIDLVTTNYYEKELQYQEKINQSERANRLGNRFKIKIAEENIELHYEGEFPSNLSGNIQFFRPSDKNMDRSFEINLKDKGIQSFDANEFSKGLYKVQVEWQEKDSSYFTEKTFIMP